MQNPLLWNLSKPCARVVEQTYLGEDGAEIIKYKIGEKRIDRQEIEKSDINVEDSFLPEDKIHLMIKKLPDGTYDLSDLTKSTEAAGWEHITIPGFFPGSDKNPKANDNIIGNNRGKPELRNELILAADGKSFKHIKFFNKAYLKKYGILAFRRVRPGHKFPEKEEFFWANEARLKEPVQVYKELFGGEVCYTVSTFYSTDTDAAIAGSPDYDYGTIIQKKAA